MAPSTMPQPTPPPSSSPSTLMLKKRQQQPSKSILKPSSSSMVGQKRKKPDMDDLPSDMSGTASHASESGQDTPGQSQEDSVTHTQSSTEQGPREGQPRKKRARVTFDMGDTESSTSTPRSASGDTNNTAEKRNLVREEVRRAIQRHLGGDSTSYDRIKELFTADPKAVEDGGDLPSQDTLTNHLRGLVANVATLDGSCHGLVHAVLASEWVGREEGYVKLFIRFLSTLAAARGAYLNSVLRMLVGYLRQVPRDVRKLSGYKPVSTADVYARVHMALRYIVGMIPAGSGALASVLPSNFPHDTDTIKSHVAFTRNLIHIIDYVPELKGDILALITEKLVKIDVQIQVDMEDFEEEMEEHVLQSMSTAEAVAFDDNDDEDENSDEENDDAMSDAPTDLDAESERVRITKGNFLKVDFMMDLLFGYYAIPFTSGSLEDQENTLELLLAHFRNIVLPTYRSRHSQFLLFHFSQASPIFVDRFATACIQIILSKAQPPLIRQYAAAYLASFVARGANVSSEVVRDVFDLLGSHLQNLMAEYEPGCRGPDLRRYATFYATAQALLYIFCFRWADLTVAAIENDENGSGGGGAPSDLELDEVSFPHAITELMQTAIASPLNPLKICAPDIVHEFARLAHHLHFIYVWSKIETNKRVRVHSFRGPMSASSSSGIGVQFAQIERETKADDASRGTQLDAYFPFDPYRLRRSGRWVEGDYVQYRGIPGMRGQGGGEDDDDDDDSRSEDEEEEEEREGGETETETETDGE